MWDTGHKIMVVWLNILLFQEFYRSIDTFFVDQDLIYIFFFFSKKKIDTFFF